jgi:hypothetical protein
MVSALVGAAVALSYALPANEIETYYYTDAHYKNEVGYTFLSCQGGIYREGKTTRYRVVYKTPCTSTQRLQEIACFLDGVQTTCPANICDSHLVECSSR